MQTTGDIHNHTSPPPPPLTLKVTVDLQGTIFLYHAKLNIANLTTFSKKNYLKILKCARVIRKNVFSNKILLPARVS